MAVRMRNGASVSFGLIEVAANVSHARFLNGSTVMRTEEFGSVQALTANRVAEWPEHAISFIFRSGELEDNHLLEVIQAYYTSSRPITMKLFTDSTTELSVAGYSDAMLADWDFNVQSD